jgi:hypothetical protein
MILFRCPGCGQAMRVAPDKARAVVLCPGCKRQVRAPAATILEGEPLVPADPPGPLTYHAPPPVVQAPPAPLERREEPVGPSVALVSPAGPPQTPASTPVFQDDASPRSTLNPALIAVGIAGVLAFTMIVLAIGFSLAGNGPSPSEPGADDLGTAQPEARQGRPSARQQDEGWSTLAQGAAGAVCGALCLAVILGGIGVAAHWAQTPCPGCGRRWTLNWAPQDGNPDLPVKDNQRVCKACGWRGP